jgi:chorismate mutase / prephenate dehydratase
MTNGNVPNHEELLNEQRVLIDSIDAELVALINRRSAVALEIGRIKMENGLPIYVGAREEQVLQGIERKNDDGIVPQDEMRHIFQAIMRGSRAVQKGLHESSWPNGQNE